MLKTTLLLLITSILTVGCASVPMEGKEASRQAKLLNSPSPGQSGLYIYRGGGAGTALKKNIWLDGNCIGETAPHVFFYAEVAGDMEHTISTESEFSPNVLKLVTARDKTYFIRQYMKIGVFVAGANLEVVTTEEGRKAISESELARRGTCSQ